MKFHAKVTCPQGLSFLFFSPLYFGKLKFRQFLGQWAKTNKYEMSLRKAYITNRIEYKTTRPTPLLILKLKITHLLKLK